MDSIKYTRKYKTSVEGCTVFIDTCYCSRKGPKKCFDLIWENDSVCFFSFSAGTGVSGDLIINKLDCDKSISGYSLHPNKQGEYRYINDEDTVIESIW